LEALQVIYFIQNYKINFNFFFKLIFSNLASQSLFNTKPLTETTSTSSLFGNKIENLSSTTNTNSILTLSKTETEKTNLNLNNNSTRLFGLSNNNNQKQIEENKDTNLMSLFGNNQTNPLETKSDIGLESYNNKPSSLFGSGSYLGLINNKTETANLNNNTNSISIFKSDVTNTIPATQTSSLFSGMNNSQNNNNYSSNLFVAPTQNKQSLLFNSSLGANLKDNFGENKITQIETNKTNTLNANINNQSSENPQSKSLMNTSNPFLQKSNTIQNSIFTSNY